MVFNRLLTVPFSFLTLFPLYISIKTYINDLIIGLTCSGFQRRAIHSVPVTSCDLQWSRGRALCNFFVWLTEGSFFNMFTRPRSPPTRLIKDHISQSLCKNFFVLAAFHSSEVDVFKSCYDDGSCTFRFYFLISWARPSKSYIS